MKIQAKFYCKDNELFFIEGDKKVDLSSAICVKAANSMTFAPETFYFIECPWALVGMDEDSYNEEFLAAFRDSLKNLETMNSFAVVVPCCDKDSLEPAEKENFTASMKHCARRIKDCENIAGFAVPVQCDAEFFMDELSAKHKQYIYFSKDKALLSSKKDIVCEICK